jgi:[acyl-carrier-protein] S-malonyltransferase
VQALCAEVPAAAAMFKRASEILGYDLLDVCVNGPKDKLDSTAVSLLFFRFSLTSRG